MATDLELAVLSQAAYTASGVNTIDIPSWDPDEDLVRDLPSGFAAQVFTKGSEVVIAFRGTDDPKINDFYNGNIPAGAGHYSDCESWRQPALGRAQSLLRAIGL